MNVRLIAFAGTFLPIAGIVLTVAIAMWLRGRARDAVLLLGPPLTVLASWLAAPHVWRDGNLLAAVIYLGSFILIGVGYPIMALVLVVRAVRNARREIESLRERGPGAP